MHTDSACLVRFTTAKYCVKLSEVYPCSLFIAATRRGAFTSKIVVELPTLCMSTFGPSVFQPITDPCLIVVLCILWIVAAALTAEWSPLLYPFGCSDRLCGLSLQLVSVPLNSQHL